MRVGPLPTVAVVALAACVDGGSVRPGPIRQERRPTTAVQPGSCDGRADDTAALQSALDGGGVVVLPPDRTCRFSALTASVPVAVDLSGSTLRVGDGPRTGPFLRVTGAGVTIQNGVIDANRRRGAKGWLLDWRGAGGRLEQVTLQGGDSIGLSVTSADASVVASHVVARDFRGHVGVGFRVGAGSLVTRDCTAEDNEYAGFFVSRDSRASTVIDGVSRRNGIGAALEGSRGGRVARFVSVDDDRFGLLLNRGASHWTVGDVAVSFTGRSAARRSATGVELFQRNHHNVFDAVTVTGVPGYGLAVAGDSDDNRFGVVALDASMARGGDPGLVIAGGSERNRFRSVTVVHHTVGVRFGENDRATDAPNDGNWIGTLQVTGARHNAIRFEWGSANQIDRVTVADSDSSGSDAHGFKGVVYFGNNSSGNVIRELVQVGTARPPNYLVYTGACAVPTCQRPATATGNRIESGVARAWSRSISLDTVGGNVVNLVER